MRARSFLHSSFEMAIYKVVIVLMLYPVASFSRFPSSARFVLSLMLSSSGTYMQQKASSCTGIRSRPYNTGFIVMKSPILKECLPVFNTVLHINTNLVKSKSDSF